MNVASLSVSVTSSTRFVSVCRISLERYDDCLCTVTQQFHYLSKSYDVYDIDVVVLAGKFSIDNMFLLCCHAMN